MRPAGERGLFSVQSPSCLSLRLLLTLRLPDPLRPAKPLLACSPPLSLGFSLCSARPAAPPHVLQCSHPPFSPCFVVICIVWKGMRCRGGLGFVPFHSASALRFSPDCFCPHFCSELKRPCRRNVLLSSHSSSGCIFSVWSAPNF